MCQKRLFSYCCRKRDIEDLEDDVSFFTQFIFSQVGIAYGTFIEQTDDSIVVDTLWSCISHEVFFPLKCEQMFAMLQQYSIRMILEQQIYCYKKFVHQSIMCKVEGFTASSRLKRSS